MAEAFSSPTVSMELRCRILQNCHLFSTLSNDDISKLAQLMHEEQYQPNEKITTEGDLVDSFYFIVKGKVEVSQKQRLDGATRDIILAILEEGEPIGLNNKGFFSPHGKRTATITSVGETTILYINVSDFHSFTKDHPQFSKEMKDVTGNLLKIELIKQIHPFVHLSFDDMFSLTQGIHEIVLPPNTHLFSQGDASDCCYLIRSGNIEIYLLEKNGEEKSLATLNAPHLIGEASLFTASPRNASARTLTEAHLFVIRNELILEKIKNSNDFAQSLMGFMVNRFRPSHNADVVVRKHTGADGQLMIMLHNTKIHRYYRLSDEGWFIWQQLDGIQTIQNITVAIFKKYHVLVPEFICNFLYSLAELGFVNLPAIHDLHLENKPKRLWQRFKDGLTQLSQKEITFTHTDSIITSIYQHGIFLFYNTISQIFLLAYIILGAFIFFYSYPRIIENIQHLSINIWVFLLLIPPVSIISVILHESGHAFTAKRFGYSVERVGTGWFKFGPVAYVDTSELWVAKKLHRLAVNVAGVYVDFIVASTFVFISFIFKNSELSILFWLLAFLVYYNGFKNLSPLNEYDGYFILSDILDVPALRKKSFYFFLEGKDIIFRMFDKKNQPQMIYLLSCAIYLIISTFIIFLIFQFIFTILPISIYIKIPSIYLSILLALTILALSIRVLLHELSAMKNAQ